MKTVNMLEAKTHLSRLVDEIERGTETEIIIARNGRPAVKLVAMQSEPRQKVKFGLQAGKYPSLELETFDDDDKAFERQFYGDDA
jgi:antitoxin (DNA-binding transcriptional repressor) of toxin-antitoxin stability system